MMYATLKHFVRHVCPLRSNDVTDKLVYQAQKAFLLKFPALLIVHFTDHILKSEGDK